MVPGCEFSVMPCSTCSSTPEMVFSPSGWPLSEVLDGVGEADVERRGVLLASDCGEGEGFRETGEGIREVPTAFGT